ncbi:hypothetical protein RSOLAG22IIIB_01238 [Rhizoctonia solani]|uniref:Uncharacterized protein n=1 Tax=Rhizoctonia solani TaxID=456999 RepID=A0A0K6G518_9AGAM|nr:hypothetical protein RSOLAG22IIIB_01238 [Rhizoctonia solani]
MRAPQSLARTDTRLELALDLKFSPLPTAPPTGPAPANNLEQRKPLKRTESYGKGNSKSNALVPTKSMQGSALESNLQARSRRDTIKPANIPVFNALHEVGDNVGLDFDTVGIARPDTDGFGVGSYLDEARVPTKQESMPTPPALTEIIPRIEMLLEGGRHLELWDAKPELCARVNGSVNLSRKTMRTIVDGRGVEIVLRGIAITASTAENPRRCENNHFDTTHPEWHVGGLSGGQQVPGRAVWFGPGATGSALGPARARTDEFSVPFHIDIPMGLVQARRDRVIVVAASAIFGSTHRPDVVRRVETEVLRLTLSNLQSEEVKIPMWR